MKYVVYGLGAVLVICALFMDGILSWVLGIVGVILSYVANAMGAHEAVGETDKTILALLMYASMADSKMSNEEEKYISEYIKRRGLSKKQVAVVAKYAEDPTKWKFSTDEEQKMRIISEIVGLIKADGVVTEDEKKFLVWVAEMINVDKQKALAKLS